MAAHSSILARRTPWTEEPGSLQSVGSQRDRTEGTEHVMHYNAITLWNGDTRPFHCNNILSEVDIVIPELYG